MVRGKGTPVSRINTIFVESLAIQTVKKIEYSYVPRGILRGCGTEYLVQV